MGLETNESLIRLYNLPGNDRGPTDHQAVAVVKPTGTAEEQVTYLCADPALGSKAMFKLGCGAIAPLRDGTVGRAIAARLHFFGGAPAVTVAVFAGIILQSKEALAQRLPVLREGLRQMVLEAAQLATQEQMGDVAKHQQLIDAGAVEHAEHGKEFTNEVVDCLQLITTEPKKHNDLFFDGLNWKSGRAFCLTSNIGIISHGPMRNKIVGQLLRGGFTATIVRVFSSATGTGQVHHEAMALARSSIDRFIGTGVLPSSLTDRLQCTMTGQPMRLMEPTAAAHAAVTPLTLRARLHTLPMYEGHVSTFAYDQMDRHQKDTVNEVSGELEHEWDELTVKDMMKNILEVAKYEGINVHGCPASGTRTDTPPRSQKSAACTAAIMRGMWTATGCIPLNATRSNLGTTTKPNPQPQSRPQARTGRTTSAPPYGSSRGAG